MSEIVTVNVTQNVDNVVINGSTANDVVTVSVTDIIDEVAVTVTEGGGDITIQNSDNTYNVVASTSPFILPDTDYNINVNGVFYASTSLPTLAP